jgi:predicted DNA-binding transcriptional regulator AlpA
VSRDEMLTVPQVIAELGVPRSTFYRWRQTGRGPRSIKLPNGGVRIRRSALNRWLDEHGDDAAAA